MGGDSGCAPLESLSFPCGRSRKYCHPDLADIACRQRILMDNSIWLGADERRQVHEYPDGVRVSMPVPATPALARDCGISMAVALEGMDLPVGAVVPYTPACLQCGRCLARLTKATTFAGDGFTCAICGVRNVAKRECWRPTTMVYDLAYEKMGATPVLYILIDVGQSAVDSGFLADAIAAVHGLIASLGDEQRVMVGVLGAQPSLLDAVVGREVVFVDDAEVNLPVPELQLSRGTLLRFVSSLAGGRGWVGHRLEAGVSLVTRLRRHGAAFAFFDGPSLDARDAGLRRDLAIALNRCQISLSAFAPAGLREVAGLVGLSGGFLHGYGASRRGLARDVVDSFAALTRWQLSMVVRHHPSLEVERVLGCGIFSAAQATFSSGGLSRAGSIVVLFRVKAPVRESRVLFQMELSMSAASGKRWIRVLSFWVPVSSTRGGLFNDMDEALAACVAVKRAAAVGLAVPANAEQAVLEVARRSPGLWILKILHGFLGSRAVLGAPDGCKRLRDVYFLRGAGVQGTLLYCYAWMGVASAGLHVPQPLVARRLRDEEVVLLRGHRKVVVVVTAAEAGRVLERADVQAALEGVGAEVVVWIRGKAIERKLGRMLREDSPAAPRREFARWLRDNELL